MRNNWRNERKLLKVHQMRKHLKWRKQRKLDEDCSGLQKSEVKNERKDLKGYRWNELNLN